MEDGVEEADAVRGQGSSILSSDSILTKRALLWPSLALGLHKPFTDCSLQPPPPPPVLWLYISLYRRLLSSEVWHVE